MAGSTCNCTTNGMGFNKRSARSGVVLHEHKTGTVVILITSFAPKMWRALAGNETGWRVGKFNVDNIGAYHAPDGAATYKLDEPVLTSIDAEFAKKGIDLSKVPDTYMKAQKEWVKSDDWLTANAPLPPSPSLVIPPFTAAAPTPAPASTPVPAQEEEATGKVTTGYTPRAKTINPTSEEFEADAPNPERYWYESEADARAFKDYVSLRLSGHDTNCVVVGPSGFGKTEGVIRLGERMGVPVHIINCQVVTTPEKWLGQMMADPARGTFFDVSQHLQWVERTHPDCEGAPFCILLYDEATRLRPELGNMLFSLLDGQQGLEVPQMSRHVTMSDKNVVFATANIGSAYSGTFAMDWALRSRFDFTMERPLPPAEEELQVLMTASPKLRQPQAEQMIAVAEHSRILWREGDLEAPISTRLLLSWSRLVAGGYSVKDAAEYTVIPVYTEDGGADSDRAKIKMAIDGKVAA